MSTSTEGVLEFSFVTSDIEGSFTITIEGFSNEGDYEKIESKIRVKN